METKINIAAILKDKPKRTKLYTDTFGQVSIEDIDAEDELGITLSSKDDDELLFYNDGRYNLYGEPILVPSKSMHDWRKFAWKKGDVLVSKDNVYITFEEFENDDYTRFKGKYYLWKEYDEEDYSKEETKMLTSKFEKANDNDAQTYINTIEKRLGGKLNRETLEVEKPQPEFKDGDIVMSDSGTIVLVRGNSSTRYIYYHAFMRNEDIYINQVEGEFFSRISRIKRFATDSEKQQLFSALAKEGKAWDSEKKQIVDLKPKIELKPFDRVLRRDGVGKEWHIDLFESVLTDNSEYNYKCMANIWKYCIPYEGNEYLLGTTKDVEG